MTITQDKVNNGLATVRVNLKKEDYEPKVKQQLKTLSKQVSLKGFRPGMVPMDMVKKMYGNGVVLEELNKLVNEEIYKYIDENKLQIIVSPLPSSEMKLDIDINNMKEVDFLYDIALAPEISLDLIANTPALTKYKIKVEDKMLDDEALRIRARFATYEYPEAIGETDVLTFTVEELNEDGSVKEGGISTVTTLSADLMKYEAKSKVLPLKKQESFEYNVFELMDRDRQSVAKNILNMNDLTALDQVGDKFRLTLNNITRNLPAEMNEEFFLKAYGENGPKSEAEMRAAIQADLDAYFDGNTDRLLVNEIYKVVLEDLSFPIPDEFLKRWIEVTQETPISKEDIEKEYPQFAKSIRWSLVQKKIIAENNIEVNSEDIANRERVNMIQQLRQYGMKDIGQEWVEQFVQKQLADKKVVTETRDQLREDKVLDYLKTKVNVNTKEVTLEEFNAIVEKLQP